MPINNVKTQKTIHTNYRFGISKDFPFVSQYSEFHNLTRSLMADDEPDYKVRIKNVTQS